MKNDSSACATYLSEYSHVSLIFIRTEDKLLTFDDGSTAVHSLDADERAKKQEIIEKIRTAIVLAVRRDFGAKENVLVVMDPVTGAQPKMMCMFLME